MTQDPHSIASSTVRRAGAVAGLLLGAFGFYWGLSQREPPVEVSVVRPAFDLEPRKNLFTFTNSLAVAHAELIDAPGVDARAVALTGLGLCGEAERLSHDSVLPAVHRSRIMMRYWLRWVGLRRIHRDAYDLATSSVRELYGKAEQVALRDPLREVRLLNNIGVFGCLASDGGDTRALDRYLYRARILTQRLAAGSPALRERLDREGLRAKIDANIALARARTTERR